MYSVATCGLCDTLEVFRALRGFEAGQYVSGKVKRLCCYMRDKGLDTCIVPVDGTSGACVALSLIRHASRCANSPIQRVVEVPLKGGAVADATWRLGVESVDMFGGMPSHEETQKEVEAVLVRQYVRSCMAAGMHPLVLSGRDLDDAFCDDGYGFDNISLFSDIYKSEVAQLVGYFGISVSEQCSCWVGDKEYGYDLIEFGLELMRYQDTGDDIVSACSGDSVDVDSYKQMLSHFGNKGLENYDSRLALWDVRQPGGWLLGKELL